MRFRTRAFLSCFVPFALLLAGCFWIIQNRVQSTVRDGLRASLLENHKAVTRLRLKSDLQSSQFLKVAGENAALKAGVQLLLQDPANQEARSTVNDQLGDLCERMGFDFLAVWGLVPRGDSALDDNHAAPLAGVLRVDGKLVPLNRAAEDKASALAGRSGMLLFSGRLYQIASVPIDQADENLAVLSVGEIFDLSVFTTPTVLLRNGQVLDSSLGGSSIQEIEAAMFRCSGNRECDIKLHQVNYLSLPIQSASLGDAYALRSLQNVDSAVAPVQQMLQRVFGSVALGAVLVAVMVSLVSAGSIVAPIATLAEHLKEAERTGNLAEFRTDVSNLREIQELTESFNRAAASIREGQENLNLAYVEFVESLASALDARDPYTAGHSRRVSDLSRAVAQSMGLPKDIAERVRVGALLHDIGKIGIADSLLQKTGRLTPDEFATLRTHPEIGRRILEGVEGFGPYLAAVELHHENWDGTGYPHGQSGETTPVEARILHVTDAYDAMTTDRPYRRGMRPQESIAILRNAAGTQFDPKIVDVFVRLVEDSPRTNNEPANNVKEVVLTEMITMEAA